MTSVKQFRIEREPTATQFGRGSFVFTDAYSVFDWGEMPDRIPEKGRCLCTTGAATFESLEAAGISTHYRGVIQEGRAVPLGEVSAPPREMAIDLTEVPELPFDGEGYRYECYHDDAHSHYLIPLEIVFRNRIPPNSSMRDRRMPADVGLDQASWPNETVALAEPVIEFSTKFESTDRYVSREEATKMAGRADVDAIETVAREVNEHINARAASVDLVHEDGKIECLYHDGEIVVADVVGTFDENRFRFEGRPVSKEVLRRFYRDAAPEWIDGIDRAKRIDPVKWRSTCSTSPPPLPKRLVSSVSELYQAGTNQYTGANWFDAPPLGRVLAGLEAQ